MALTDEYEHAATINIETVRYALERFQASVTFSPYVLEQIRIERYHRAVTDDLVFRLVGVVALWKRDRLLKVPANWWQHFKQRWFPRWALKRWPVLYEWYDAGVVLPQVPVAKPEYNMVEFPVWRKSDA